MKISVIIPVYNTEANKLRRCLKSIVAQDFNDFECIIIDDGSIEDIGKVCDDFAAADSRLRVIHKPNGGVSSARNAGLDHAKGEWIVFVDSDDYILPFHLSALIGITNKEVDMVLTSFRFLHPNKVTEHQYPNKSYNGKEEVRDFISYTDFLDYQIPWDKMYRRSVISEYNLRFDEKLSLSEDRLFCYHALAHVSGIAAIATITYIHDGTDMSTLSYRQPDVEMQKHICLQIGHASSRILERFGIDDDYALQVWKSYWSVFETLIRSLYNIKGSLIKAVLQQRKMYHEVFDFTLYNKIKHSQRVKQYMHDLDKRLMIHNYFFLFDVKVFMHYLKGKNSRI